MLSGSIVAIVTPMKESGELDLGAFKSLILWHKAAGTEAVVVAGTTGESTALSLEEVISLVDVAIEHSGDTMKVIVGNGAACTAKSKEITQKLNVLAIDGFLTVTPYYVKPSQSGLIKHFEAVADAATHPVYLYNVPGRTAVSLDNESVFELAKHDNILGIKDATGELSVAKELIQHCKGQFSVLSGDDATSHEFMALGGDGVISVTANLVPEQMAKRCQLTLNNDLESALHIERQIEELHTLLFCEANPIPVKWALAQMKKVNPYIRLPLTTLETERDALLTAMRRLSLVA